MCFSAPGSFLLGCALVGASGATLKRASKKLRVLALVSFLFGIQQIAEGLQWLSPHPSDASLFYGYIFLLIALVVWPTLVPAVVRSLEKRKRNRQILKLITAFGALVSLYFLIVLITEPFSINIVNHSINYAIAKPYPLAAGLSYMLVVTAGTLMSSDKYIQWFGMAILISAIVSWFIFSQTFVSVWCFFAAVLSILIYRFTKARSK
ncbi:MAG: DUF6629 family protein [bacterium]